MMKFVNQQNGNDSVEEDSVTNGDVRVKRFNRESRSMKGIDGSSDHDDHGTWVRSARHFPTGVVVKIFGNSGKIAWNEGNQELGAMCTHIKGVMVTRVC